MLTIEGFAKKTGLSQRTIKRAIKEGRIRSERSENGDALIPDDEIAPLSKAQIQAFIWVILRFKNDKGAAPDISTVSKTHQNQLVSMFKQLSFRNYIDSLNNYGSVQDCFNQCRITDAGFGLVESKRLPGSIISKKLAEQSVATALTLLIQQLPTIVQVVSQFG